MFARRLRLVALAGVLAVVGTAAVEAPHLLKDDGTAGSSISPATTAGAPSTNQDEADDHAPTGTGDVVHLQPALKRALQRATTAAAADGVTITVTSGWRSKAHQEELFEQAIRRYGSAEAASHWVLPPSKSEHVRGAAIDVGPRAAAKWLEHNGVRYGLCRRYANEWWHFELLAAAKGSTCPALQAHA